MKRQLLALGLAALLAACGGGGDSSSDSSNNNPNNPITDPTSPTYTGSLKAFAETWTAGDLHGALTDLAIIAGQTANCAGGGTASFTDPTQTVTKCIRRYPADNAYTGTYTVTGTASAGTLSNLAVDALTPDAASTLQFKITGGQYAGSTVTGSNGTDTTNITSGSATFAVGSSTYTLKALNTQTLNDGSSIQLGMNGIKPITFSVEKGSTQYDVYLNQSIKIVGNDRPSSGIATITYTTTTACSPLKVTFISNTQFSLICPNDANPTAVTKNWTDADVVAALKAAQQ